MEESKIRKLLMKHSVEYHECSKKGIYVNELYVDEFTDELIYELNKELAKENAKTSESTCNLQNVNGSAFVIMFQKKPLKNILFQSDKEARNYIKMQNPKRTFKEPKENVFVCSRYGTTFEIVELHYR